MTYSGIVCPLFVSFTTLILMSFSAKGGNKCKLQFEEKNKINLYFLIFTTFICNFLIISPFLCLKTHSLTLSVWINLDFISLVIFLGLVVRKPQKELYKNYFVKYASFKVYFTNICSHLISDMGFKNISIKKH